jgi:hypothetical protein
MHAPAITVTNLLGAIIKIPAMIVLLETNVITITVIPLLAALIQRCLVLWTNALMIVVIPKRAVVAKTSLATIMMPALLMGAYLTPAAIMMT